MSEKNTLSKEKETLSLWLIFAVKMWVGSSKLLICEFSGQQKQRICFLIDFSKLERSCCVHSAPSQHKGIQAGGWSPEPLLPPKPTFLSPSAPGALLIYRNKTKPKGGGISAEHSVSSGWRLSGKCSCLLSQWWLRLHHGPCFCGGRSRLSSAQLFIFPKPVGKATPLNLCISAKFYWKWLMFSKTSRY